MNEETTILLSVGMPEVGRTSVYKCKLQVRDSQGVFVIAVSKEDRTRIGKALISLAQTFLE